MIGGLAGFLAATGASALGYVLASKVLNVAYVFNPWLWVIGTTGGAVLVILACFPQLRSVLSTPPLRILPNFS